MIRVLAFVAIIRWPFALDGWFGADKLKHFLMSALVHSAVYSTARAASVGRGQSQAVGGAAVLAVGLLKEMQDRRSRKPFSMEDLVWDAAGAVGAGSLLNGTR